MTNCNNEIESIIVEEHYMRILYDNRLSKKYYCVLSICNMIMKYSVFLIRKSNYSYYESATSPK